MFRKVVVGVYLLVIGGVLGFRQVVVGVYVLVGSGAHCGEVGDDAVPADHVIKESRRRIRTAGVHGGDVHLVHDLSHPVHRSDQRNLDAEQSSRDNVLPEAGTTVVVRGRRVREDDRVPPPTSPAGDANRGLERRPS